MQLIYTTQHVIVYNFKHNKLQVYTVLYYKKLHVASYILIIP